MNELIAVSDDEREALIVWNLERMGQALDRDTAMRYWQRASLLIRGRSQASITKMERERGLWLEGASHA